MPVDNRDTFTTDAGETKRNVTGNLIYFVLVSLVVTVPSVFSTITYDVAYLKRTILEFAVLLSFLLWLIKIGKTGQLVFIRSKMNMAVVALWVAAVFSFALSTDRSMSAVGLWRVTVFAGLYLLTLTFCDSRKKILTLISGAVWVSIPISIYGIIQYFGKDPIIWIKSFYLRIWSTITNPSSFAGYLLIIIPLALTLLVVRRSLLQKAVSLSALTLALTNLYMTKTKGAWLSLIAGTLLFAVLAMLTLQKKGRKWSRRKLVTVILIVVVSLAAFAPGAVKSAAYFQKTIGSSSEVRIYFWQVSLKMILDHPWIGTGIGTYQKHFPQYRTPSFRSKGVSYNTVHPHNEYIETLTDQGVVGLFVLLLFIFILARVSIKLISSKTNPKDWWPAMGLILAVFMTLTHNMTNITHRWVVCPALFWIATALIATMQASQSNDHSSNRKVIRMKQWRILLPIFFIPLIFFLGWKLLYCPTLSQIKLQDGSKQIFKKHYFQAIQDLRQAIKYDRLQFDAYYKLGYVYDALGNTEQSLQSYYDLHRFMPDYAQTHLNIAMLLAKQEKWQEAHTALLEAAHKGLVHPKFIKATLFEKVRNSPGGEPVYGEVLEWMSKTDPENMNTWNSLGMWYYENDYFDQAVRAFKKTLEIHPGYINALYHLAAGHYMMGNRNEAIKYWETVSEKRPHSAQTYFNIGLVFLQQGDFVTVREKWNNALATDKNKEKKDVFKSIVFPKDK